MTDDQLWLPFDFQETTERIKALPHYETPRNDNQRLLEWQYQYRQGNDDALAQIYTLSVTICGKFINKEAQHNKHVKKLSQEARNEKAHNAAVYLISRMLDKKKFFYVSKNYPGYLYLRVLKELYNRRKVDKLVDFVDFTEFYKEGTDDQEEEENE